MILPSPCNTSPFQGTWRDFLAQIVRAAVAAAGRTTLCFYMICPESCVMRCFTWRRSDTPGNNLEIAQRATNTSRRCLVQGPCVVPFGGRLYCRCSLSFVLLGGARCLVISPCNTAGYAVPVDRFSMHTADGLRAAKHGCAYCSCSTDMQRTF